MSFQQDQATHLLTMADYYRHDVTHVPPERLGWSPHPGALTPLAQLDHLAAVTDYFVARGTAADGQAAFQAPAPSKTLKGALARFDGSVARAAQALAALPDAALDDALPTTDGTASVARRYLLTVPAFHLAYHWGQLCLMQTMWGDEANHILDDDSPYAARYAAAAARA